MADPIPLYPEQSPEPLVLKLYPRRIRGKSAQEAAKALREGGFLVVPSTPGNIKCPDHFNPDKGTKYPEKGEPNTRNLFSAPVRPGGGLGVVNTGCRDHDVPKAQKNIEPHLRVTPLADTYKKEKRWMDIPHPPLMIDFTGGGGTQIRAKPVLGWIGFSGKTMPGSTGEVFSGIDDPSKLHYGFCLTEPTRMGAGDKQYRKDRKYTEEGYVSIYNVPNPRERIIQLYGLVPLALEASVALSEANLDNDDPDWCIELPDWPEETVREIRVLYGLESKKANTTSMVGTKVVEFFPQESITIEDKKNILKQLWGLRSKKDPDDEERSYQTWINTGINIFKDDDGPDGLEVWTYYSKLDEDSYDEKDTLNKWKSFTATVERHSREDDQKRAEGKHVAISGLPAIKNKILRLSGIPASYREHCELILADKMAKIITGTAVELFDRKIGFKIALPDAANRNDIWVAMEKDENPDVQAKLWKVNKITGVKTYVSREMRLKNLIRDHSTREHRGLYIHIEGVGPEALTREELEQADPEALHHFVPLLSASGVKPKINMRLLDVVEKWLFQGFLVSGNDPVSYEYIIGPMSVKVKRPGTRINTMPIIRGEQGCGKSSHVEAFMMALGYDTSGINSCNVPIAVELAKKEITGGFNKRLQTAVVGLINELGMFTKAEEVDALKSILTSLTLSIELKGVDIYTVENKLWLVATTNGEVPILIDISDRRFVYMNSIQLSKWRPKHCQDNASYWSDEIAIPLKDKEWQGALIAYLALRQPVEGINLMSSPLTEAKRIAANNSADKAVADNVRNYIKWKIEQMKRNNPALVDWVIAENTQRGSGKNPIVPVPEGAFPKECYLLEGDRVLMDAIPAMEVGGSIVGAKRASADNLFDDYCLWKSSGDKGKTVNGVDISRDKVALSSTFAKSLKLIAFSGYDLVAKQGRLKSRHDKEGSKGLYVLDITKPLLDACLQTDAEEVKEEDATSPLVEARQLARDEIERWMKALPAELRHSLQNGGDICL